MQDSVSVITPEGAIGITASPGLREALLDACANHPVVVVDFSKVTATDSTTLGLLVGAAKRCRASGTRLLVSNATRSVERALTVTGLMHLIDMASVPAQLNLGSGVLEPV